MTADEHGKRSTYDSYGCRCALCTKANRDWWRQYRERHRERRRLSR